MCPHYARHLYWRRVWCRRPDPQGGVPRGVRTFYGALAFKNDPNYTSWIYMRINGAMTVLAAESATTWESGNIVELCGVGPNLTLNRDGVTVLTAIDSNITGGRIGLRIREDGNLANVEISAFSGGNP
jgi:hypothetical protein